MPAANDARAILNEAEEAVGRNDHASAERLLRQALALQETSVGPQHPEVAKTLNNLAILCEMTGKPADAEACYRRAYEIAKAVLPADDPLVVTSRQNLEEFCTAQDFVTERAAVISVSPPAPPPAPAAASSPPPRPAEPPPSPPAVRTPSVPVSVAPRRASAPVPESGGSSSRIIIGMLSLAALVLMIIAAWWFAVRPSPEPAAAVSPSEPALSPAPPASAPPATPDPVREPEPVASPTPAAPAPEPSRTTVPSSAPTVVSAQVCRSLSTTGAWQCESATGTQAPGTMYFYTRVASATDTVVEHRWYRDDRLHQRVQLRIGANQGGFRTYSRTTVGPDRAGTWKVELRSSDGQLLHEEGFSVQ